MTRITDKPEKQKDYETGRQATVCSSVCLLASDGEDHFMKKVILLVSVVMIVAALWAQEKSQVKVKGSESNNGVVIVTVQENQSTLELQCNKNSAGCEAPAAGSYWMVRLPKNWGMYDCQNVDLYPGTEEPTDTNNAKKIGDFCLVTK